MDPRGNKVESWKLTDEQKKFQKQVAQYKKIKRLLDAKSLMISYEAKQLTDLMLELNKRFKTLQPPAEQTKELDGMNFEKTPTDQNMMINY